jgi:hypothetical protein
MSNLLMSDLHDSTNLQQAFLKCNLFTISLCKIKKEEAIVPKFPAQ